jgi:hypothetical protein
MKPGHWAVLALAVAAVVAAAAIRVGKLDKDRGRDENGVKRAEITPELLKIGLTKPTLWVYYNDSEVNARYWADFGARSSRALNVPALNLFYETIVQQNGNTYRIEVISGLSDLALRLGGQESMPPSLQNPLTVVGEAEEDWIRAAVLARYGGLWVSSSVVCISPFGTLGNKVVAFGEDDVPMYSGSKCPGFRALWSPRPAEPMMVDWEARCRDRLTNQLGGRLRGDAKSDWIELSPHYSTEVHVAAELGRNTRTGKKLELEDILAVGTEGHLPFPIPATTVYVVVPAADLRDRRAFGWFLRMSEEQIMSADMVVRYLIEMGRGSTQM